MINDLSRYVPSETIHLCPFYDATSVKRKVPLSENDMVTLQLDRVHSKRLDPFLSVTKSRKTLGSQTTGNLLLIQLW